MVKFVGMECARDALATEIRRQLDEDKCMCAVCYVGHKTLARSILRDKKIYAKYRREIQRDIRRFDKHWNDMEKKM